MGLTDSNTLMLVCTPRCWRERLQQALLDEATAGARAARLAHLQSNKQLIAEGSAEAVAALIAKDPNMALVWDSLSDEEQCRYATRIAVQSSLMHCQPKLYGHCMLASLLLGLCHRLIEAQRVAAEQLVRAAPSLA